ncbi:TPA: DUF1566 domain-containing protein [Legionella pneumophila]|nr:DUF1566 domain-containing protein [Legionella pneumophila]HAU0297526.1 DUF1566 domain-containing protein [Legionella pneumophila]
MQRNIIKHTLINRVLICLLSCLMMTTVHAAKPLWTLTPAAGSNPTQTVAENGTANVQYIVQNQSHKSKRLAILPIPGVKQTAPCQIAPKGQSGSSCTLNLAITGSSLPKKGAHGGPALCQTNPDGSPNPNQCYQPATNHVLNLSLAETPPNTTLNISLNTLALATQGILTDASGAGNQMSKARRLIITNTGAVTAMDVDYTITPNLPAGTTVSPASCGNIAAGDTCELTVTPGNTPSAAADMAPAPSVLTVKGSNTPTAVTSSVIVLTYGNRYQGGFVFSIDDSTVDTMSVGGKVAAFTDQAPPFPNGIIWSSDGTGGTATDSIPGIDETSSEGAPSPALPMPNNPLNFVGCNGATDGLCNVGNIFKQYPTIPTGEYAAGLCSATIAGFNDWYLPAICEMGFDDGGFPSGCGAPANPAQQNMQSNLVDNGDVGSLAGYYWSSTEGSGNPQLFAWDQFFATGGGSSQLSGSKNFPYGVRCVRALTI